MAKVKVTVAHGVVNDVPAGQVVEVEEHDLVWLAELGYIESPKAAPKKAVAKEEPKEPAKRPARRTAPKKDAE